MKIGKIIKIILFTMIFFILQSCVKIETSMNINSDLSGTSNSEVSILKNLMPEEQLKKEIEKLGVKKFEFEKIESDDNSVDKYNVKLEWKTEEELEKILAFINTGMTMSELNSPIVSPNGGNKGKNKENVENPEHQKKDESKTVEIKPKDKDKDKENVDKNSKEKVKKSIFTKEHGTVTVNMGTVKINKLVIKVHGKIIADSIQEGIVSDAKDEITFYEGDKAEFKYKDSNLLLPILIGVGIAIAIIVIGAVAFVLKKKNKEKTEEEEYDEFAEEAKDEMEKKEAAEEKEKIEEAVNEISGEVTEISENNEIKPENDNDEEEKISGENI